MNTSIYHISLLDLLWVMIPVAIVIVIYMRWTQDKSTLFYALFRMLIQLILIGYVLTYIFTSDSHYLVILILSVMLDRCECYLFASTSKAAKVTLPLCFCFHFCWWGFYVDDGDLRCTRFKPLV